MWRLLRVFLHDPPQWRPIFLTGYLAICVMGVIAVVAPPRTIESQLGTILATVWGILLTVGGVGGAALVYTGKWWLERTCIALVWLGLGTYGFIVGLLALSEPGNRWPQFLAIGLAGLLFLVRFLQIRGWDERPPIYDRLWGEHE